MVLLQETTEPGCKIFDTIGQIGEKNRQIQEACLGSYVLYKGSTLNFSWLLYSEHDANLLKLGCSIIRHNTVKHYEINIIKSCISIYSYEWKYYEKIYSYDGLFRYSLKNDNEFILMVAEFKIVLLDILQDILLTMGNEFNLTIGLSFDVTYMRDWFQLADREVRIYRHI